MNHYHRFFLLASMTVGFQIASAQTNLYIKAGLTASSFKSGIEYSRLIGFQAGVGVTKALTPRFAIQSELLISTKGGVYEIQYYDATVNDLTRAFKEKIVLKYFQVPVVGLYYLPVRQSRLFIGAGPYIAAGAGGTIKSDFQGDQKIGFVRKPNNRVTEYRRLDAGLTATTGIEKNRFIFGINYDFSLLKSKAIRGFGGSPGFSEYNRSLGLSLGYNLNKHLQVAWK